MKKEAESGQRGRGEERRGEERRGERRNEILKER